MANTGRKSKELTDEEKLAEIKKLSDEAQAISARQIPMDFSSLGEDDIGTETDTEKEMLNITANPEKSHRLYYTMMAILKTNLPRGPQNEKLRRHVYEEKSLFLNRGAVKDERGIKGSDERMAYIPMYLQQALDKVTTWASGDANPFDIYMAFKQMNEELGFYKSPEETTAE
jgi:hypothetical protein